MQSVNSGIFTQCLRKAFTADIVDTIAAQLKCVEVRIYLDGFCYLLSTSSLDRVVCNMEIETSHSKFDMMNKTRHTLTIKRKCSQGN